MRCHSDIAEAAVSPWFLFPAEEASRRVELVDVLEHLEKDRLRYILRVIPAVEHPEGGIEHRFFVFQQQGLEGLAVA